MDSDSIPHKLLKMDTGNNSVNSASADSSDPGNTNKREKLVGFLNWPRWAALTKAMLVSKDVWDLVSVGPRQLRNEGILWDHKRKEDRMAIGIATEIIQGGVSDDLFNNIIDENDLQRIWEKLRAVCSQIGTGVVYSILQELFTYPKINKPKGFDKLVTSVFSEVRVLVKWLRAAVTPNRDIWDSIAIVVATDSLHEDFEHVISGLLGQGGEKSINKIQSILASSEAKFLSKRAVGTTAELAYMSKTSNQKRKSTATSEDECFNCHKMGHFRRDCRHPDYRSLKKKNTGNAKQDREDSLRPRYHNSQNSQQRKKPQPRRANVVTNNNEDEDSDPEPFRPRKAFMTTESTAESTMSRTRSTWYLDSCASRHLTNDQSLFVGKIHPKS